MTADGPWVRANPGSTVALAAGCRCAVLDNNHGKHPPWPPNGWWISEGCPVHDPPITASTPSQTDNEEA